MVSLKKRVQAPNIRVGTTGELNVIQYKLNNFKQRFIAPYGAKLKIERII